MMNDTARPKGKKPIPKEIYPKQYATKEESHAAWSRPVDVLKEVITAPLTVSPPKPTREEIWQREMEERRKKELMRNAGCFTVIALAFTAIIVFILNLPAIIAALAPIIVIVIIIAALLGG
ncbi:MAG: hypothetical protein WCD86_24000 [Ktedonobacteraceae bacterium]